MASPLLALLLDKTYWTARPVLSLVLMGGLFNLAGWAWVVFVIQPTSERTLLHYTVQGGVDAIGPGTQAYLVPAIALVLLVVNAFIGSLLYKNEKFLAHFLLGFALFLQAIFCGGGNDQLGRELGLYKRICVTNTMRKRLGSALCPRIRIFARHAFLGNSAWFGCPVVFCASLGGSLHYPV